MLIVPLSKGQSTQKALGKDLTEHLYAFARQLQTSLVLELCDQVWLLASLVPSSLRQGLPLLPETLVVVPNSTVT